ncbi:serine hydrolase [Bradyrhizobium jicamae]|nr:serine hydrolase [Bradyrhizobium jicamae]
MKRNRFSEGQIIESLKEHEAGVSEPDRCRKHVVSDNSIHTWPSAQPEAVGVSPERLSRIRAVLQQEVDAERMPGAVVMITRRGNLIYSEAVGFLDKAAGKPMTEDAIFRLCSMTKPLASVGAMMLVEEGKVQLNDHVSKFLPELAKMDVLATDKDGKTTREPAKRRMTIHDLFRHTAGLTYGKFSKIPEIKAAYTETNLLIEPSRLITPEQFTAGIAKAPLVREPGTTFEYGLAVDVLGHVVEAVSGQRLSAFLDERLFRPLKMADTGFKVPQANWTRIAEPLRKEEQFLDMKIDPSNDLAGEGGVSTAADYLRFCQMMLNGGTLDGRRYLSPTTVKLMTSDHLGNRPGVPASPGISLMGLDGYTFGLGFLVRQGPGLAGVPGSEGEYMLAGYGGTFFWIDPTEQLAVVFMAQTPGSTRTYYYRMIKALVAQALGN